MNGTGTVIPSFLIQKYYTPKFIKFQAFLAKTPFFVDYANSYVDFFMLTSELGIEKYLSFSTILAISRAKDVVVPLNIDFASFLAKRRIWVN